MQNNDSATSYDFNDTSRNASTKSSTTVFLVAWLTGATGFLFSILAIVIRWALPTLPPEPIPFPKKPMTETQPTASIPHSPPKLVLIPNDTPSTTHSRLDFERHVSFSLRSENKELGVSPHKRITTTPPEGAQLRNPKNPAHCLDSVTLVSSPPSSLDLPPLDDFPLLPFDSTQADFLLIKSNRSAMSSSPPPVLSKPFKFKRSSSTPSARSPRTVPISSLSPDKSNDLGCICEEGEPRQRSLFRIFGAKVRRSKSASRRPGSAASCPSTPCTSSVALSSTKRSSHRASASTSAIDVSSSSSPSSDRRTLYTTSTSPGPSPLASGQNRRAFPTFNMGFRSSPTSPPSIPLRTQPYGPPYNCPLPQPSSRSTHHNSSSMSSVIPSQRL